MMLSANTGRLSAIQDAARTIAWPTSPSRSISLVTSAKYRSESVSPCTSDFASPSCCSSAVEVLDHAVVREQPVLLARTDACSRGLTAPVEAYLTWAMNVREVTSRASRANAWSS